MGYAAHSSQVEEVREQLIAGCQAISPRTSDEVAFYSATLAEELDTAGLDGSYWYRNLRETVNFEQVTRKLIQERNDTFIEMSPHPVLTVAIQATADAVSSDAAQADPTPNSSEQGGVVAVGSLRRQDGGAQRFVKSLSEAWVSGVGVDWPRVLASSPNAQLPHLPTYAFQRKRYWLNAFDQGDSTASGQTPTHDRLPFAGAAPARADGGQQPAQGEGVLAQRLQGVPADERQKIVLHLVCAQVAAVLGDSFSEEVDPELALKEMGFDSLLAVELRNRLNAATGMKLATTLVFDYPTAALVADHMLASLDGVHGDSTRRTVRTGSPEDPVAIVGMACRLPGGVSSPQELWQLLAAGADAISEFPLNRGWDLEQLHDPDASRPGTTYVREAGFLHDMADFDAEFFSISPREALAMDPQQRLLLEVSWEALEDGGIRPDSLRGSRTGVFAGTGGQDYAGLVRAVPGSSEGFQFTGTAASVLSGRIAYTFGFEGPAISVDTACSSSLVAIHMATRALQADECSMALAGGVTLMSSPGAFIEFAGQRVLARDGRCKSFAEAADGTNWSEGAGVILLERLSDARRLGHKVLAVVRGSAINQDGASNGLTAPNGPSQQRVIREALSDAGLSATEVDVVEAHGTGTALGDPIEAQALLGTYGQDRPKDRPLWLGSIKSNIGHTGPTAGVAGVIKMVLALEHHLLPRTLHVDEPSSQIDWSSGSMSLLTDAVPWMADGEPRRAGISAFGISGTNMHLILEDAPIDNEDSLPGKQGGGETSVSVDDVESVTIPPQTGTVPIAILDTEVVPWVLSGSSAGALRAQAVRVSGFLRNGVTRDLRDVGLSLATTRSMLDRRALLLGDDFDELSNGLRALSSGELATNIVEGQIDRGSGAVFVFPGQGSQWPGMATDLMESSPLFSSLLEECEAALAPFVDWSLAAVLRGEHDAPGLERIDVVQPVLFAIMVALAGLWRACGVEPQAVVGHSQGEIAAVCVAGGLSLEDGARLISLRSRALVALAGKGGMVSVALAPHQLADWLERCGTRVSIAAVNGPGSSVISGDPSALIELLAWCQSEGVRARELPVDYAAHSTQVEEIQDELLAGCAAIVPREGKVPFYSSVSGGMLDTAELDPNYWYRNLRETVRFEGAVRTLIESGQRRFIEISPHPVLTVGVQETSDQVLQAGRTLGDRGTVAALGSLRREDGGPRRFLTSLGEAWVRGAAVDWDALFAGSRAKSIALPTYAFQRKRYWPAIDMQEAHADRADASHVGESRAEGLQAGFWKAVEEEDMEALAGTLGLQEEAERSSLEPALPLLSSWRRRQSVETELDRWRYRIAWAPLGDPLALLEGTWLVVVPSEFFRDPWVQAVVAALDTHGARVIPVTVDRECAQNRDAMAACLQLGLAEGLDGQERPGNNGTGEEDGSGGRTPITGIVSLLALDEHFDTVHPAISGGLGATVALIQALADTAIEGRLWLLSRAAVAVASTESPVSPVQSMVWGLGRTLGLEQPERLAALVDMPLELDGRSLERLCVVLGAGDAQDQLAVRSTGLFSRRLVRAPVQHAHLGEPWRPRSTVMVTGATGGVGGQVARWLARAGAEHLLLVSRSGRQAGGAAELGAELERLGSEVSIAAVDVTDRQGMCELIESIPPERPLDAIMHAAGFGDLATLEEITAEQIQATLAPKVLGGWHLHELTEDMDLSAFVLFSSLSSLTGSARQGHYAAANSYLDALAEHRRAHGLRATSIAWGLWAGEGAGRTMGEGLRRIGTIDMAPERAVEGIQQALDRDETCVALMDIDWKLYAPTYAFARSRPLIEDLPEVKRALADLAGGAPEAEEGEMSWTGSLSNMSERERERSVLELVCSRAAAVMGRETAEGLDVSQPFRELGFDSLMAVELRTKLQAATGLALPATVVFDHPSCVELGEHIARQLTGASAQRGMDVETELDSLELAIASVADEQERTRAIASLQALAERLVGNGAGHGPAVAEQLELASDEEIFSFIDKELGPR